MYSDTRFKKSALHSAVLFALSLNGTIVGTGIAQAASEVCIGTNPTTPTSIITDRTNFTMLDGGGYTVGGTNDVAATWSGTAYSASSDYTGPGSVSNVTMASTTTFFGHVWTAHDIQMFLPGTYSFDVTAGGNPSDTETGTLNVTVPAGMLGMHMLFDWNTSANIDVFVVVAPDSVFGPGFARSLNVSGCDSVSLASIQNCLWDGPGYVGGLSTNKPAGSTVWMLSSTDGNGDGIMGVPMPTGGPFQGFNANFNIPATSGAFSTQTLQNTCATFVDTIPNVFLFTAVTNATAGAQYESNTITVSGLASGVSTNISITGGDYAVSTDGGTTWSPYNTTTPSVVQNTDMVKVRGTAPLADGQTTSVVLSIGGISGTFNISTPAIATAQGSNFTMLDITGNVTGGTNDVVAVWDGTYDTNVNSTAFNRMTLSSVTPFFSFPWTAHHIRVFGPGTYTIDSTCTVADLDAGISNCNHLPLPQGQTQQYYTFTVGAGQIGTHMLFNWNTSSDIDVVDIWNLDAVFGPSQMYTGNAACNNPATLWDLMSTDWDGDGQNGAAMIDGPFIGFKANFNIRLPGSPILTCSAYTPTVNISDPSNMPSGCSIATTPVESASRADWWLVGGFIAWLGLIFKRRRKNLT